MTLLKWLRQHSVSITELAARTGLHYTTTIAAVYGKPLGRKAATKMNEVTGVPLEILLIGDPKNQTGRKKTSAEAKKGGAKAKRRRAA